MKLNNSQSAFNCSGFFARTTLPSSIFFSEICKKKFFLWVSVFRSRLILFASCIVIDEFRGGQEPFIAIATDGRRAVGKRGRACVVLFLHGHFLVRHTHTWTCANLPVERALFWDDWRISRTCTVKVSLRKEQTTAFQQC